MIEAVRHFAVCRKKVKMKNIFLKAIGILLCVLFLLTACGEQANSSGMFTSESEALSSEFSESDILSAPIIQTEAGQQESNISEDGIIVANLYGESSFFSGRVINFGKENPAFGIQYQAAYQDEEVNRILMEVANGKGPDILYLERRSLESLRSNGALGEIGQLITSENKDALLPGAIQMGTYEDKLLAVPLSVYVRSLLTSKAYWQEDTWSAEDILSVLEEHHEIEGLFLDIAGKDDYYYNMSFMTGADIRHSPFLTDGKSGFDCQEFRDILMIVKNLTQKAANNSSPYDRILPLTEGNYLGIEYLLTNMGSYSDIFENMGENANLVGYPYNMGSSHYLMDNGMLVVNQNAMAKEGIKELVNDLLSIESQRFVGYSISVREDIPESALVYDEKNKLYIWTSPDNKGFTMPAKDDGSSCLEEYVELLKSAQPMGFDSSELFEIVIEEANGYFYSDKDVDEVIDIIQRRVQLYLDEGK